MHSIPWTLWRFVVTKATVRGLLLPALLAIALSTAVFLAQTAQPVSIAGRVVIQGAPSAQAPARLPVPARRAPDKIPVEISDVEFWRMVSEFSEPGGAYPYENFVSNEWNQQTVIPALKQSTRPGEVYIGVGPEQNFTYAAALRAKMAFVVDIRRQNMLEHLLYKALFELAPNRADFVSRLFSRKRPSGLDDKTAADALFAAYENVKSDADFYLGNLEAVKSTFKRHGFQLSGDDILKIEYVYQVFYRGGPGIDYQFASVSPTTAPPSYTKIMNMSDGTGHNWSYLATEESFQYVREMQRKNLIVPLVGNFAGPNAIRNIARYLKEHDANVSAFYASNVETYLDEKQTRDFYANLLALPMDSTTTAIRYVDFNHTPAIPWWNSSLSYLQVISPMSDLVNLASTGSLPAYPDLLRLVKDPSPGGTMPRFTLPISLGPGRPFVTVAIDPQSNGTFRALLPTGVIQVGAATGLPPGFTVKSITYGSADLLRESVTVSTSSTAELVITLNSGNSGTSPEFISRPK